MEEKVLTNSEWYVMDCLWAQAPMTVMELAAALEQRIGWAKSTTITTLHRMEEKGLIRCEIVGRTRRYYPTLEQKLARRQETRSFLERVYQGSVGLMVSAMTQDRALSREEIDELYAILRRAKEEGS
ncbi:BlaI/MecI/CopY family transcriptional regulator [Lawsonibacter sp. LCP25S3_G6]|uniref:BlaI/MecI/CopY family transcriptional regulator n=1 Tax=unclassified Lawsonibacter TaxID=2617946 RepID=UPI003F9C4D95